jgi:hypothetical protein
MLAPTFGCGMLTVEGAHGPSNSSLWIDLLVLDREGGMKWRVMIELAGSKGTVQLHEVSAGGSTAAECSAETLGLTVAEGKMRRGSFLTVFG